MASKLLPLNDAAALLGVTPDELTTMRLEQQIYGYRDGSSWKFKIDDLERLKEERAASKSSPLTGDDDDGLPVDTTESSSEDDGLPVDLSLSGDDDEIVLLSEVELGASGESTSSTIIGQGKAAKVPLAGDSDLKLGDSAISGTPGSDVKLAGGSDVNVLGSGSELPLGLSESATVVKSTAGSDLGLQDEVKLIGGGSGSGLEKMGESGLSLGSDSGLSLASDSGLALADDEDLGLADEPASKSGGGSAVNLSEDEDVLGGGTGSGSDITHRPSDSGILLIDPSDSGLALDKPFDLGAGSDPSMQTSDYVADTGDLGELKADDDFLLTPLEEASEDESDSGSQVIMLETEGEFDDATATLLASQVPGLSASMLEEESPLGGLGDSPAGTGRAAAGAAGAPMMMVPAKAETPFSALQVLGLAACTIAVAMCGIMLHDVVRNMWSWDSSYGVNSTLMNTFKW